MSARQVVITQIHDGAAILVSPLPKDLAAADVLDLLSEAVELVTEAATVTPCQCQWCSCPITLSPAEAGVCADCQAGEHTAGSEAA